MHEIIVVDDESPDNLASIVERTYAEGVVLVRQPHGGASCARNTGIDHATGDVIAFLDADDYWEPTKVERQLAVLAQHPEVGLIAGRWFEQTPGGERVESPISGANRYDRVVRVTGPRAFHLATIIWTGTVAIRRDALGDARFVPGLEPAEDRDLWVRIVNAHPAWLVSEPLATAVLEPGSISRSNIDHDCGSMLRVVERHRAILGPGASRMWRSYSLFRSAGSDPRLAPALSRLVQSLWLWPGPYVGIAETRRLGRMKRLAVLLAMAVRAR